MNNEKVHAVEILLAKLYMQYVYCRIYVENVIIKDNNKSNKSNNI